MNTTKTSVEDNTQSRQRKLAVTIRVCVTSKCPLSAARWSAANPSSFFMSTSWPARCSISATALNATHHKHVTRGQIIILLSGLCHIKCQRFWDYPVSRTSCILKKSCEQGKGVFAECDTLAAQKFFISSSWFAAYASVSYGRIPHVGRQNLVILGDN